MYDFQFAKSGSEIGKQTFSRKRCDVSGFRDPEYPKSRKQTKLLTRNDNSGFRDPTYRKSVNKPSILSKVKLLVFDTRKSGK